MCKLVQKLSARLLSRRQSNRNRKSAPSSLPCIPSPRESENTIMELAPPMLSCLPPIPAPDDCRTKTKAASSAVPSIVPPPSPDGCDKKSASSVPRISPPQATEKMNANTRPPSFDLLFLINRKSWNSAIAHCQEHPQDAKQGEDGSSFTPLYHACQLNAPLEVIRALIQANPDALECGTRNRGELPLHEICKSPSTSVAVLREFLIRPATACHRDKVVGITPLSHLWMTRDSFMKSIKGQPWTPEQQDQVKMFEDKVELLVDAIAIARQNSWYAHSKDVPQDYINTSNDNSMGNRPSVIYQIHALVSLGPKGIPLSLLEYMCDKYPQQLQTRDGCGLLPLHVAAGFSDWFPVRYHRGMQRIIQLLLSMYPGAARTCVSSPWDGHETTQNDSTLTHQTLDLMNGRYPLHIALARGHMWRFGVRELFEAAPEVLSIRDPLTKLYPFQLAAISYPFPNHMYVDMDTIFELLIHCPLLVLDVSSCWC